jgi:hypothetical protein
MTDHAPDLDATHARQGRRGLHVFVILVVSLTLVVIAFAVIYATHAGGFAVRNGSKEAPPSAARTFNGPEPAPRVTDTGQNGGHSPGPTTSQPSASNPS